MASPKKIAFKVIKWFGIVLGSIVFIVLATAAVIFFIWNHRQDQIYDVQGNYLTFPAADSSVLAHGEQLTKMYGCKDCHLENLGGQSWPLGPMGTLSPANLTSGKGGIGGQYTESDWVRAIRHGVGKNNRSLLIMPSPEFNKIGKRDMIAMISFLKSIPPVDNPLPPNYVNFIGRPMLMLFYGVDPFVASQIDHNEPIAEVPQKSVSLPYGAYVAQTCQSCHGEELLGKPLPSNSSILATNLLSLNDWSKEDFGKAVTKGLRPNGDSLLAYMPRWTMLDDTDVEAVWLYISELKKQHDSSVTLGE